MNRSGNTGQRTLLAAMLLSLPGPLVLGAGLLLGRSSTQLADFIRRAAELGAIIVSWAVYRATIGRGMEDKARKARLEHIARLCVGASMCLGGAAMALIALFIIFYGSDRVLFFMETKQSLPDFPSLQVFWTYLPLPLGSLATLLFVIESVLFGSQHRRPIVMIGSHSAEAETEVQK